MNKKQIVIIAALVVFVGLVVTMGLTTKKGASPAPAGGGATSSLASSSLEVKGFLPEVPKNAVETKPKFETPLVGQGGEGQGKAGVYEITASAGGYAPSSFTVRQDNIVELTFFSEGGDFDFSIPALSVYFSAPSGGKMTASFRAGASGTFLFECRDFCPSGRKIKGTLIVMPR